MLQAPTKTLEMSRLLVRHDRHYVGYLLAMIDSTSAIC